MTTKITATSRDAMRNRLLDATRQLTIVHGWGSITMAAVATETGVSRQTVYNEFGSKPKLAEALVYREVEGFLNVVRERLLAAEDAVTGIHDACFGALDYAAQNPLVPQALTSMPGDSNDLLPLLTTDSQAIIEAATIVIVEAIAEREFDLPLSDQDIARAVEYLVRLVLSAITRPSKTAAETADDIAWIFALALRGAGQIHEVNHINPRQ